MAHFLYSISAAVLLGATSLGAATFTVSSNGLDGPDTLKQAILDANATPGPDRIEFKLASNRLTITLDDDLPEITEAVVIDGSTQTGFAGKPLVVIRASQRASGTRTRLLRIAASNCTVRGLVFNRISTDDNSHPYFPADAIQIVGGGTNVVAGCWIGLPPTGVGSVSVNPDEIYGAGVMITNSAANVIGGTTVADRNVIASCRGDEVVITGAGSTANKVVGNYLGFDATGLQRSVSGESGVRIEDAAGNFVGGSSASERNYIVPNFSQPGVRIVGGGASNNVVSGNWVGLKVDGSTFPRTDFLPTGIAIQTNATANIIGGTQPGTGNLVGGLANGIIIRSSGNKIFGNWVGLGPDGITGATNDNSGIAITGDFNQVGGPTPGERNIASCNRSGGISVSGKGNIVQGNWVGLDSTGRLPRGNGGGFINGSISISGLSTGNLIGGPGLKFGNVVAASTLHGIALVGATVSNNIVQGNIVGLDVTGTNVVANKGDGIALLGARFNTIGAAPAQSVTTLSLKGRRAVGTTPIDIKNFTVPPGGNIISGNLGYGARCAGSFTSFGDPAVGNKFDGNVMGLFVRNTAGFDTGQEIANTSLDPFGPRPQNALGGVCIQLGDNNSLAAGYLNLINRGDKPALAVTTGTGNAMLNILTIGSYFPIIDLGAAGPTPNHAGVTGTGPNISQNFPVIKSTALVDGQVVIDSQFAGKKGEAFTIQVIETVPSASAVNDFISFTVEKEVAQGTGGTQSIPIPVPQAQGSSAAQFSLSVMDSLFNQSEDSPRVAQPVPVVAAPMVSFSETTLQGVEGDLVLAPMVRTGDTNQECSVVLIPRFGTDAILSAAAADIDLAVAGVKVTFTAKETFKLVAVHLSLDNLEESKETFELQLVDPVNCTVADGQKLVVIIVDKPFVPEEPPKLGLPQFKAAEGVLLIPFTGNGIIEFSKSVTGPWEPIQATKSPYQFKVGPEEDFYVFRTYRRPPQ